MITKVDSIAVVVKDIRNATNWYKSRLGFQVRQKEGHWVTLAPKGSKGTVIHLCETKPLEKGNTGISFGTDDLEKTYKELAKKGVKFTVKPRDDGAGLYAMFKDPDGNIFWLTS